MTASDTSSASHAECSARRWARALYVAAFSELPGEVTSTPNPNLAPEIIQFAAYPALNQAPLSISVAGLVRDPTTASNLLVFAQRFETALKLAVAPVTSVASQPDFAAHPRPAAAATARGPAGAVTVVEHEQARRPHHLPWVAGDSIRLALPIAFEPSTGLLLPPHPIAAIITSPDDGLERAVQLTPTRDALAATHTTSTTELPVATGYLRWTGVVARTLPPFALHLHLSDPGSIDGQPFATASWMVGEAGFAIRINMNQSDDPSAPST